MVKEKSSPSTEAPKEYRGVSHLIANNETCQVFLFIGLTYLIYQTGAMIESITSSNNAKTQSGAISKILEIKEMPEDVRNFLRAKLQ